jgi:demethylmenaquinone methyltransferase/2-methoxy-6-polyprenyl-1,4-benzoquinol methylase
MTQLDYHTQLVKSANTVPVITRRFGTWHVAVGRSMFTPDELVRHYDRIAAMQLRVLDRLGYTGVYHALMARLMSVYPNTFRIGARVLDCGAGAGALSLALGTISNGLLRHSLLDLSAHMLEVAGARLQASGIDASCQQGDVRAIPHDDGTFDFAMAAHVVEHLPDPIAGLREMYRVLKPGGRMLVLVTRRSLLGTLLQLKWPVHLTGPRELHDWLAECGLTRIYTVPLQGPWWCNRVTVACVGTRENRRFVASPRQTGNTRR